MTDALTKRMAIPELVREYELAVADIRTGYKLMRDSEARLNNAFTLAGSGSIYIRQRHTVMHWDERSEAESLEEIKRQVWRALVERLELRRMMSVSRAKELDHQLERGELPEITIESVAEFARGFESALPEMLCEAIDEVFEWLRPRRSEYKTNSELEIGKRVILERIVESGPLAGIGGKFRVNYHWQAELSALENVFSALDGKGSITKGYYSELQRCINETPYGHLTSGPGRVDTTYFRAKVFRNGNMHLEFKRLDLLKRFNEIAGGRRLRPKAKGAA